MSTNDNCLISTLEASDIANDNWGFVNRDLTQEEAEQDLTIERFADWYEMTEEDFAESTGLVCDTILAGLVLADLPHLKSDLGYVLHQRMCYSEIEELGFDEELQVDGIYKYYAEMCNLYPTLKYRVNQIIACVTEKFEE